MVYLTGEQQAGDGALGRRRGTSRPAVFIGLRPDTFSDPADVSAPPPADDILALDEALSRLAAEDALAARVVELRHFAGLGHDDVAAVLGVTVYQARQKWAYARAWLRHALGG